MTSKYMDEYLQLIPKTNPPWLDSTDFLYLIIMIMLIFKPKNWLFWKMKYCKHDFDKI